MTAVELIRSSTLSPAAPYAYAATAPADARLIFLAGACPIDAQSEVVSAGDYAAQAEACLSNLVTAWDVVRAGFGEHDAPSTLLGVTVLGYPDQLVEIEAVAAVAG
jgi:enamine deaminase RidA (YjgF/YER057c/UK114 family)